MSTELRVLVCQLTSVDNVDTNLQQIHKLIDAVPPGEKLDLVCLPENALYMRVKEGEKIVTSGNFLIDSESRLKSAMAGMK